MSVTTSRALPEGTITMLFSDIEGSTKLLQQLGPRCRSVLSDQRRIIRAAVAAHGGHEMGTEGDSFYVVFASAADAVRAAVQAQRELVRVAAGGDHLRVRMGLHTGEPERHEDAYVGLDVHRAARVAAAANGGQVVLTAATWALVRGQVDAAAKDLGRHRLKDIDTPEHLFRLLAPGLDDEDRPVRTVGATASLPTPPNSLVAREDLVDTVDALLRRPDARLVTLLGPGGVGKTRVAIAVAERCAEWVAEGVFFVGLADVRSNDDVWTAIADVTGAPPADRSPADLLRWLRDRSLLLVLDNVEQLPDIHEVVSRLMAATTAPEILLTSRRPLHVLGERLVPVPPLETDDAVELFVQRLRAVRPGPDPDRAVVRELCDRVDGLPLAVELLAARGQLLGPEAMLGSPTASTCGAARRTGQSGSGRCVPCWRGATSCWTLRPPPRSAGSACWPGPSGSRTPGPSWVWRRTRRWRRCSTWSRPAWCSPSTPRAASRSSGGCGWSAPTPCSS